MPNTDSIPFPYIHKLNLRGLAFFLAFVPVCGIALLAFVGSAHPLNANAPQTEPALGVSGPTNIEVLPDILHAGVKHFGINVGGQHYWDGGQILKNLVFRNPGFEGETWQSILECRQTSANSCSDGNQYNVWPAGFLNGASYEVLSGTQTGHTGTISASSAAGNGLGVTLTFSDSPKGIASGDFILVRTVKPGNAQAGWWTNTAGGATFSTDSNDLSPESLGQQALQINASGAGQSANLSSYFDSTGGQSFIQLHGSFALHFRAKWIAGQKQLSVHSERQEANGPASFFSTDFTLTPTWQDYTYTFTAHETGSARGTLALTFGVQQSSILLDDVALTPINGSAENTSAFRDEVVQTLQNLHPGILRFMDSGTSFGSTFDDLIAPPYARRRGGSAMNGSLQEDVPIGLEESLVLAKTVGAEPWFTLPATTSPQEAANAIEFLAGPASSPYGAKRAALGQTAPWTSAFPLIHLEFGNEMWNDTFAGTTITDPAVYGARANSVFASARASHWFNQSNFDLLIDGQAVNTYWTAKALSTSSHHNSIALGPYLFNQLNDASSTEAIFGSMLAQPEQWDAAGIMAQQLATAQSAQHPATPAVYEVNLDTVSTTNSSIAQADIDRAVPSLGAGLDDAVHMLQMLRNLGIVNQCLFALDGSGYHFNAPANNSLSAPLWGAVLDMGGPTNRVRPNYLSLQLANQALLANELTTRLSGANPTWNQPASTNDGVTSSQPHLLQVFAFEQGTSHSLILLNLSRTVSLPVTFSGSAPANNVTESRLTSTNITDNNEQQAKVATVTRSLTHFNPSAQYLLPPYSMTVLAWQANP